MQLPCPKEKSPIDCCWFSVPYGVLLKTGACLVTSNADLQVSHAGGRTHSAQFSKDRTWILRTEFLYCALQCHIQQFSWEALGQGLFTHPLPTPPSPVSDPEPLKPRCTSSHQTGGPFPETTCKHCHSSFFPGSEVNHLSF